MPNCETLYNFFFSMLLFFSPRLVFSFKVGFLYQERVKNKFQFYTNVAYFAVP